MTAEASQPKRIITMQGNVIRTVGEIVQWKGHAYRVTESMYISEKEAEELEETHDAFDMAGCHYTAELV